MAGVSYGMTVSAIPLLPITEFVLFGCIVLALPSWLTTGVGLVDLSNAVFNIIGELNGSSSLKCLGIAMVWLVLELI